MFQSRKTVSRNELETAGQYTFTKKKGYEQNRTLQQDLDFLRDEGADIVYDRKSRKYVLRREGSLLVNIKISGGEVKALAAGLKMAAHFLPHLEDDAGELWEKIAVYIPQDLAQEGYSLARSTIISIPAAKVKPEVFSLLTEARHKRRAVSILYVSPGNKPREWTVSPGKERHHVRIMLRGRLAETVREVEFHPTQKIEEAGNGEVILTAEVPYLDEAARWIMSCAGDACAVEPEELRGMVRDYAGRVLGFEACGSSGGREKISGMKEE